MLIRKLKNNTYFCLRVHLSALVLDSPYGRKERKNVLTLPSVCPFFFRWLRMCQRLNEERGAARCGGCVGRHEGREHGGVYRGTRHLRAAEAKKGMLRGDPDAINNGSFIAARSLDVRSPCWCIQKSLAA